jgi:hypothetical protein
VQELFYIKHFVLKRRNEEVQRAKKDLYVYDVMIQRTLDGKIVRNVRG